MGSDRATHLSDEQLARFQDGELSPRETGHLETCQQCANRLRDLEAVGTAYAEYRDAVREPLLSPAPKPWVYLETLVERHEAGRARKPLFRWLVPSLAAAVCAIVAVTLVLRNGQQPAAQMTELLERSASAELSQVDLHQGRLISVRANGRNLVRPAVFMTDAPVGNGPDLEHLQTVFAAANYSWREPLSPRSFQVWRRGLKTKRDTVSVIGEPADKRSYRVRTDSPNGTLRSASLTLRAQDLHPTDGTFEFEGEGTVELTETYAPAPKEETAPRRSSNAQPPPPAETPAGPEDTLRVLAALNEIGADVGEPIAVSDDPQHRRVLVHASGLSRERQRQVDEALKALPRVALDFNSAAPGSHPAQPAAPERYTASIPAPLRQWFEDRLGGAVALQEITDRVLETSASTLARAHAVQVLGEKFPPEVELRFATSDRELLQALRQRHLAELERLATRIRADLKPLLAVPSAAPQTGVPQTTYNGIGRPWQAGVPSLVASAQETDSLLNRLLAGSYSQSEGESMLHGLTAQLDRLERAIHSQQREGR
jgi:hypothetical protein